MKVLIADTYAFYVYNSRDVRFPKKFKDFKIIWNMREALLEIWKGEITELAIPEEKTPGYDFFNFVQKMVEIGQIKSKPTFHSYNVNIIKGK